MAVTAHSRAAAVVLSTLFAACPAKSAPRIATALQGVAADGVDVQGYTLVNDHGMSVKVLDWGGIITELNVPDRHGAVRNVVLELENLSAYRATATLNALIGRYANRLKGGFTLDGVHYSPTANANGVTLHGGTAPYGARHWRAEQLLSATAAGIALSLLSPDGDQGFPGALALRIVYTLTQDNRFTIDYEASTDRATVVNLTNHLYFNLAGNGSGTIYGHRLQVFADEYTPVDDDLVPTGLLAPVAGTALDFREPHVIGERVASSEPQMVVARGYDHNFVLRKAGGERLSLAARLVDPASGRSMEVRTTEPGLQVYSANLMTGSLVSSAGRTLRQGDGLALETQHFPNSPNVAAFPSTVLRPGEILHSTTVFSFSTVPASALH